jgi:hypothetical protein
LTALAEQSLWDARVVQGRTGNWSLYRDGAFFQNKRGKILADSKMTTKQASTKTNRSIWVILGSSIPITLIVIGIIKAWLSETHGIVDATTEQAVFFGGLYFALPCGLLSVIVGMKALSKGLVNKKVAIPGIIIGVLSIVIGLISWVWFFMISAFTAAF